MGEDCGADGARPHAQTGGELAGHLWVAGQVLPQAALVHVELAAHGARVVGAPSLCWVQGEINKSRSQGGKSNSPGTPEALGSLWTNFMCSINSSPVMHSLLQMGQQLGLGPPTRDWCCKKTFMSCNSSKAGLKYVRTIRPLPDSARVKEKN